MNVLVVAAHPDDEVLGCGATIARYAREGHSIFLLVLGEGMTSRYARREEADFKLVEKLQEKAKKVAELLGAKELLLDDLPDNRFDTVPLLDIVKKVEAAVEKTKPQLIFTHHHADLNIDHQLTQRAVLTATRPLPGRHRVQEILSFEVPSSTEWSFGAFSSSFQPNLFLDVRDTFPKKIEALKIYDTECQPFPHPRSREALEATARKWGSAAGLEMAEAFQLIRGVR